jgi:hypothetical protein
MCKHGSPPPAPPTTNPRRRMAIQDLGVLSAHPRTRGNCFRGRMPTCVRIPPDLHLPYITPFKPSLKPNQGFASTPQPRRDHAPCSQVTRDSPPNPTHHARPLVSARPPRCVHPRSSTAVLALTAASQGTHLECTACHCYTGTVVYRSQRVVQVDERALSGDCGQSATRPRAMVDTPTLTGTCMSQWSTRVLCGVDCRAAPAP